MLGPFRAPTLHFVAIAAGASLGLGPSLRGRPAFALGREAIAEASASKRRARAARGSAAAPGQWLVLRGTAGGRLCREFGSSWLRVYSSRLCSPRCADASPKRDLRCSRAAPSAWSWLAGGAAGCSSPKTGAGRARRAGSFIWSTAGAVLGGPARGRHHRRPRTTRSRRSWPAPGTPSRARPRRRRAARSREDVQHFGGARVLRPAAVPVRRVEAPGGTR